MLSERERGNLRFKFLFDTESKENIFYRWKIFSFSRGESNELLVTSIFPLSCFAFYLFLRELVSLTSSSSNIRWSTRPVQLEVGGAYYLPPPLPLPTRKKSPTRSPSSSSYSSSSSPSPRRRRRYEDDMSTSDRSSSDSDDSGRDSRGRRRRDWDEERREQKRREERSEYDRRRGERREEWRREERRGNDQMEERSSERRREYSGEEKSSKSLSQRASRLELSVFSKFDGFRNCKRMGKSLRGTLCEILESLSLEREVIQDAMAFALDHSEYADDIIEVRHQIPDSF
jgi:hypothetical protein